MAGIQATLLTLPLIQGNHSRVTRSPFLTISKSKLKEKTVLSARMESPFFQTVVEGNFHWNIVNGYVLSLPRDPFLIHLFISLKV